MDGGHRSKRSISPSRLNVLNSRPDDCASLAAHGCCCASVQRCAAEPPDVVHAPSPTPFCERAILSRRYRNGGSPAGSTPSEISPSSTPPGAMGVSIVDWSHCLQWCATCGCATRGGGANPDASCWAPSGVGRCV